MAVQGSSSRPCRHAEPEGTLDPEVRAFRPARPRAAPASPASPPRPPGTAESPASAQANPLRPAARAAARAPRSGAAAGRDAASDSGRGSTRPTEKAAGASRATSIVPGDGVNAMSVRSAASQSKSTTSRRPAATGHQMVSGATTANAGGDHQPAPRRQANHRGASIFSMTP